MPSYVAFIGHQPAISIAELASTVPGFHVTHILGKQAVLFDAAEPLDPKALTLLGGTISIAEQLPYSGNGHAGIKEVVYQQLKAVKGKAVFSLRTIGLPPNIIRELYRTSKDVLKKHDISSRYIGNEREPAVSVLLHDSGVLDPKHGAEIVVIKAKDLFWVGRTIAAQDVNAYAKRDMKKPVRDTTVGLLPPKLAQILLNFGEWLVEQQKEAAGIKKTKTKKPLIVLDPFCGTGVLPMESLLRGWTVLASDNSQKAVNGSTLNIEWLRKEEKILKKDVSSTVWKQDATKPFDFVGGKPFKLKELPQVVVTETSLGPNLKERPMIKDIQQMKADNEKLQMAFLENIARSLPGVPIVATWPVWYAMKKQIYVEKVLNNLEKIGYEAVLPPGVEPHDPERKTLLYRRPDQFVGREIVLLMPKVSL
ncbi:MAG: hypothetical protein JWM56_959 [Candidatus Peribacteria bacterium]|nr:hypothetical protein [Candidatus Peribacteria bacterium]